MLTCVGVGRRGGGYVRACSVGRALVSVLNGDRLTDVSL